MATRTISLYILFAIIATAVNISAQVFFISTYSGKYSVSLSVIAGTVAGLPVKYWLDKKYIFYYQTKSISHDGVVFLMYSFMAIATTLLFWVTEAFFHLMFNSDNLRYAGGIIGLSLGYAAKYQLDKKYVFRRGVNGS